MRNSMDTATNAVKATNLALLEPYESPTPRSRVLKKPSLESMVEELGGNYVTLRNQLELLKPIPNSRIAATVLTRASMLTPAQLEPIFEASFSRTHISTSHPLLSRQQKNQFLEEFSRKIDWSYPRFGNILHVKQSPFIVGGGPNIPGIKGLIPKTPIVKSKDQLGACWTPWNGQNAPGANLIFGFDVDAFSEVALVLDTATDKRWCSAVVVANDYVLTAAHCFTKSARPLELIDGIAERFKILVPNGPRRGKDGARQTEGCSNGDASTCDYMVGDIDGPPWTTPKLKREPIVFRYSGGDTQTIDLPTPDIAVVKVDFKGAAPPRIARLRASDSLPKGNTGSRVVGLTRGGYGISENSDVPELTLGYWFAVEGTEQSIQAGRALLPHPAATDSKICLHDSGGPVFADTYVGADQEVREVLAIISGSEGVRHNPSDCTRSKFEVVQLLTEEIVSTICNLTKAEFACRPIK